MANDVGWTAGAIQGPSAIVVTTDGKSTSDATAIALLKETLSARPDEAARPSDGPSKSRGLPTLAHNRALGLLELC